MSYFHLNTDAAGNPFIVPEYGMIASDTGSLLTDDTTLTASESGQTFSIATDAKTITLPSTVRGVVYRFVNTGADGAVALTISPAAADAIFGNAGLYQFAGTDNVDIVNTKVTAKKGDMITIWGDGVDGWHVTSASGNWVSAGDVYPFELVTDDVTVSDRLNGKVYSIATDAKTFTLPAVSTANQGVKFTFINSGAEGNNIMQLAPNADDAIFGNISASAGANADATTANGLVSVATGADNGVWTNTKATANQGDRCTIVSNGVTGWNIIEGVGIWATV